MKKSPRERAEKDVLKYWFVAYSYVTENGFGFNNCWVSGEKFLEVKSTEDWVKRRNNCRSATVLSFQRVPRAQYIHGLANLDSKATKEAKGKI